MAICPFAVWRPVQNHGGNMTSVRGLVMHVQVGNNSLYGYFNNPASGVSAHFWASKSGILEQYVETGTVAWAQAAGNPNYLSVETEGFPTESLTSQQITTVTKLLAWSAQVYHFPITGPVPHGSWGFTPHCNPDGTPDPSWGNHSCPERLRLNQMPTIVALAQVQPTPEPPPDETTSEDDMDSVKLDDGTIVSHFRTPENHYIEMTRSPGMQGQPANKGVSLIDLTAQYPQFEAAG